MKAFFVFLTLLFFHPCFSQSEQWMFRDLVNYEVGFLASDSSFSTLHPVQPGGIVAAGNDTLRLAELYKNYSDMRSFYAKRIRSYCFAPAGLNDSLVTLLHFYEGSLVEITVLAKGNYYLNNITDWIRRFDIPGRRSYELKSDSVVHYGNRIVTYGERAASMSWYGHNKKTGFYYFEDYRAAEGVLNLRDEQSAKRMPSWCGNCNNGRTWEKLSEYIRKRKAKEARKN